MREQGWEGARYGSKHRTTIPDEAHQRYPDRVDRNFAVPENPITTETVTVLIDSIYIRNAFNAIMFGAMSGADNIKGTVTISKDGAEFARFAVKASYALGGLAGGQNQTRLGWLSSKFAEETAKIIVTKD